MKNVAVTGISGYLGTGLLQRLDQNKDVETIIGIDLKEPRISSPKLKFYARDIRQPFGDVFAENKVDAAVHLAFVVKPTHDYKGARRVDIDGAKNFMDACVRAQTKRLLYLSSCTAYGVHRDSPPQYTEESPLNAIRGFQYSWDKAEADKMFQQFMKEHPDYCVTIVRSAVILGPRAKAQAAVGLGMFQAPVAMRFMGYNPPQQYLHEDDLADVLTFLLQRGQPGIFNAGADGSIPYSEVIAASGKRTIVFPDWVIRPFLAITWALHLQSMSSPEGLEFIKYHMVMSNEKLKKETGFKFRYNTRETVTACLDPAKKR